MPATLMVRLGFEALVNQRLRLVGRVGGSRPQGAQVGGVGEVGGWHVDRAGRVEQDNRKVLPFKVMARQTLGTFLRCPCSATSDNRIG